MPAAGELRINAERRIEIGQHAPRHGHAPVFRIAQFVFSIRCHGAALFDLHPRSGNDDELYCGPGRPGAAQVNRFDMTQQGGFKIDVENHEAAHQFAAKRIRMRIILRLFLMAARLRAHDLPWQNPNFRRPAFSLHNLQAPKSASRSLKMGCRSFPHVSVGPAPRLLHTIR